MEKFRQLFKYFNHFMLLLWQLGLGSWVNGWPEVGGRIMVLTHLGRKSGLRRRTPVNYAMVEGDIYCIAGFGSISDWYRNILLHPLVEVWLPGGWWAGQAEALTDSEARLPLLRQVLLNSGFAAHVAGINPHTISDEGLAQVTADYRLIRIQRQEARTGTGGPGELAWVWPLATMILVPLLLLKKRAPSRRTLLPSLLLLLGVLAGTLTACGRSNQAGEPIRIGVIVATAPGDTNVTSTLRAGELAVAEINDAGGLEINGTRHNVELVTRVIENTPEEAVEAAQQLINQEAIVALVGPQRSNNAIPVSEVAQQAGIPMISPASTNPKTTEGKPFVFRVAFIDPFQGGVAARFAREDLDAERAAVLYDIANEYNRDIAEVFREVFEAEGGEIVAFESYTTDETDFTRYLEAIKAAEPDVLFLPNFFKDLVPQTEQARAMGIEATFLGSDSWNPVRLAGNPQVVGAFGTHHWHVDVASEKSQAFRQAFRARFGEEPLNVAALTYDAFHLLFEAMRRQNAASPEAIRQGLTALTEFEGVTGKMTFDENRNPIKSVVILEIQDGSARLVKVVEPDGGP